MSTPALEGYNNTDVVTGGVFGATVSESATQTAGMHGASVVQSTGYGTPTGVVKTSNFPGATANVLVTAETLSSVISDLIAKGILGA